MLGQGLGQVLGTDDLIKETQCLVKNKSVGSLSTPHLALLRLDGWLWFTPGSGVTRQEGGWVPSARCRKLHFTQAGITLSSVGKGDAEKCHFLFRRHRDCFIPMKTNKKEKLLPT